MPIRPFVPRRGALALLAALLAAALAGCAPGSGEDLNAAGRPLAEGGDLPLAATLESIQANLFDPGCVTCHSGAAAPLGLRLDAAASYANLVDVRSRQNGSLFRVDPGDPDASYLVRKLEGTAGEGGRMPLNGPAVPQETIGFVRQWILEGALPAGSPAGGPPAVVALSPAPGSAGPDFPAEITAGFDRDVDASTVNALTFTLVRAGGDGAFGDANDVPIAPAAVGLANPRLAVMDLAGVAPAEDLYRVTLAGSGPNVVLGVDGMALDGEFAGGFPSGDGQEGGDFVATFEIAGLQPTLDSIQQNVFTPTCATAGCHTGPAGPMLPAGMDLSSADASFANLVGVESLEVAGTPRVAPNDADASYLVMKLEGAAGIAGEQMPFGGPYLDQATIDVIRAWIDAGAVR